MLSNTPPQLTHMKSHAAVYTLSGAPVHISTQLLTESLLLVNGLWESRNPQERTPPGGGVGEEIE